MASAGISKISLARSLVKELRLHNREWPRKSSPIIQYVMDQFRVNQVTTEQICRSKEQMEHLATTYLCLLESARKHETLTAVYQGSGEKSIDESAKLVGLKLPNTPDSNT